jgi:hypothetical protein
VGVFLQGFIKKSKAFYNFPAFTVESTRFGIISRPTPFWTIYNMPLKISREFYAEDIILANASTHEVTVA